MLFSNYSEQHITVYNSVLPVNFMDSFSNADKFLFFFFFIEHQLDCVSYTSMSDNTVN